MSNATITPAAIARQRENGLQRANRVRHQRRLLRERIARLAPPDGAALAGRVLRHPPDYTLTMTVTRLLTAVNGFGSVRAKAIAGPRKSRLLGGLSDRERAVIASACRRRAAHLQRRGSGGHHDRMQALRALAAADKVRLARARALREIAQAPTTAAGAWRAAALINASRPGELDGLSVKAVLEAVPGVHHRATRQIMRPLSLTDGTRLEMLSRSRSAQVATALINRHSRLERRAATTVADGAPAREQRVLPAAA